MPIHRLALGSLRVGTFDNLDFDGAVEVAQKLGRYEFMFTAVPLRIEMGMGSPLNLLEIPTSLDTLCNRRGPECGGRS